MPRITALEVQELGVELTEAELTPFIAGANLIINQNLLDADLTEEELKEIEKWLSGHLASIKSARITDESVLGIREKKENAKLGMGLDGTTYGQMAKLIDRSGKLEEIDSKDKKPKKSVMFRAL